MSTTIYPDGSVSYTPVWVGMVLAVLIYIGLPVVGVYLIFFSGSLWVLALLVLVILGLFCFSFTPPSGPR